VIPGSLRHGQPLFFGWKVAWIAFTVAVFSYGIGFCGPLVFLQALHATRGWTITSISAAITTHFLLSAAMVAYLPNAHRRFGLARTTLAGVALSALGVVAWQLRNIRGSYFSLPSSAALIAQKEFEPGDVPRVVALVTAINQAVFGFAPGIFGVLRDLSGEYAVPFAVAACVQLAAVLIVLTGRRG
jgi:hypothetical protein